MNKSWFRLLEPIRIFIYCLFLVPATAGVMYSRLGISGLGAAFGLYVVTRIADRLLSPILELLVGLSSRPNSGIMDSETQAINGKAYQLSRRLHPNPVVEEAAILCLTCFVIQNLWAMKDGLQLSDATISWAYCGLLVCLLFGSLAYLSWLSPNADGPTRPSRWSRELPVESSISSPPIAYPAPPPGMQKINLAGTEKSNLTERPKSPTA